MLHEPIRVSYVEHGAGGSGPVVLIHGFPLVGAMWDDLVPALADHYHLIVPDLRGHGASAVPPGPYLMDDHARDILSLLDRLGVGRAAMVGLSMGGYVTIQLLTLAPERVSAAVLADTRGAGDDDARKQARATQADLIRSDGLDAFAYVILPRMFSLSAFRGCPDLVARFRQMIVGQQPEAVIAALQGLAARPNMLDDLRTVACPTLVVVGSEDVTTTPEDARDLAAVIPNASLVVLDGAGHMANWEQPAPFNKAVRAFLDRTIGQGGAAK